MRIVGTHIVINNLLSKLVIPLYGQLGLGDVIDRNIPSEVTFDGCLPKRVSCGWWHTLLLAESPT